jgi:type II secretory pathway component GspD/PulD (secretin)
MKHLMFVCTLVAIAAAPMRVLGESPPSQTLAESSHEQPAEQTGGVSITKVIDSVSHKTGKKYLLDPRVHAQVQLVGEDVGRVSYPELLTILEVYGFTAVESGGYVLVIPESSVRTMPIPTLTGKEVFPDSQYVSAVIPITKMPAATLVPMLRPLLPIHAHLSATVCGNALLMIDVYANVRRIESLIKELDIGEPYKPAKCEAPQTKP